MISSIRKLGLALVRSLQSKAGQITSGLMAMGALAWLLWPSESWRFEPEPALTFLGAVMAWIASHTGSAEKQTTLVLPPSAHDVALLARLRATLTEEFRAFLREQDFGSTFRTRNLDPLFEVADTWRGEPFEFDDHELQPSLAELFEEVRQLSSKLALWTAPIRNPDFSSAIPQRERELDDPSEQTWARVRELNERATRVTDQLDEFLRTARRRLQS